MGGEGRRGQSDMGVAVELVVGVLRLIYFNIMIYVHLYTYRSKVLGSVYLVLFKKLLHQ